MPSVTPSSSFAFTGTGWQGGGTWTYNFASSLGAEPGDVALFFDCRDPSGGGGDAYLSVPTGWSLLQRGIPTSNTRVEAMGAVLTTGNYNSTHTWTLPGNNDYSRCYGIVKNIRSATINSAISTGTSKSTFPSASFPTGLGGIGIGLIGEGGNTDPALAASSDTTLVDSSSPVQWEANMALYVTDYRSEADGPVPTVGATFTPSSTWITVAVASGNFWGPDGAMVMG